MTSLEPTVPDVKVENCGDAIALLVQTINQVRKGDVDPRIANSVGFLTNILLKAMEHDKLETRIEHLEALLRVDISTIDLSLTGTDYEKLNEQQTPERDRASADTEPVGHQSRG